MAGCYSLDIEEALLDSFLFAGLNSEICLSERNFRLRRITILSNQITGIPRESNVVDFPRCIIWQFNLSG